MKTEEIKKTEMLHNAPQPRRRRTRKVSAVESLDYLRVT